MSKKSAKKENDLLRTPNQTEKAQDADPRELQSMLNTAEEVAKIGIWRWDLLTQKVTWSDEMFRLFGVEPDNFDGDVNRVIAERIHPEDAAAVFEANRSVLEDGQPSPLSYRIRLPDGTERTVWAQGKLIYDETSQAVALTGYVQDITERKQAEEKLKKGEEQYRYLFENNPHPMWAYDLKTMKFLAVNDAAVEKYGYSRDEFMAMTIADIRPPEDVERLQKHLARPRPALQHSGEWRHELKDGRIIDVEITSHIVNLGGKEAALVVAQDITERRKAERALRESEERYRLISDNAADVIWVLDPMAGRFTYISPSVEKLRGYTPEEVMSQPVSEALTPESFKMVSESLAATLPVFMQTGQRNMSFVNEVDQPCKDGSIVHTEVTTTYLFNSQGQVEIVGVTRDITERRKAELELKRNERLLRLFVEHSPAAIAMFDRDMKYIAFSRRFLLDYGLGEQDLTGRSHYEVFPEMPERWKQIHRRCLAGAIEKTEEDPFPRMDGRLDWVRWEIRPWYEESEKIGGLILFSEVITERKLAKEQQQNFYDMLNASLNEIYIFDAETLHFEFVSKGALHNLGYALDEMYGMTPLDVKPSFTPDSFNNLIDPLRRHEEQVINFETFHRRANGSSYPVEVHLQLFDQAGHRVFLAVILDITERKHAEEAIHRSERQMKALVTSLDDIVFEMDEHGTYLNIWTADQTLLARPKAEMLERQVLEIMGREQGTLFKDAVQRVLATGVSESIEYPLDVIGGQRWFMARINPIFMPNVPNKTASVLVRDITERKRVEEQVQVQLKRMRALSEIDRVISSSLDLRLSLDVLLDQTLSQLRVDAASVLLLDSASHTLEYGAGKGFRSTAIRKSRMPLGQGFAGQVGLERKLLRVPDVDAVGGEYPRKSLFMEERFVEYIGVPLIAKGILKGVLEVFHRSPLDPDPDWMNYLETLGGQAAIAIENAQLFEGMQRSNLELITAYDATIEGWSRAMDLRDKETEGHTQRVVELTLMLGRKMGMSEQEIVQLRRGALLHDIGKLGVPDHILHKPDKLDENEWVVMRQHPAYAFNMLMSINYLQPALDIPYCHHEKWDGSGYPRALKGGDIPLAARIFAIVDVWDALRSDRPYRTSWSAERTREYIIAESGRHFDPRVVEIFLRIIEKQ